MTTLILRPRHPRGPTSSAAWPLAALLVALLCLATSSIAAPPPEARGHQFVGFTRFSGFATSPGSSARELVLTSPVITSRIAWDELIASWNADTPTDTWLKVEVRALYPEHATKYYVMGLWSSDPARYPRESALQQKDEDGDVLTDTLQLQRPCTRVQLRLTLGGELREKPELKFLGLCLSDTRAQPPVLTPNEVAWGRTLSVPERSQMLYPDGKVLCSPTTVSMLMSYWAQQLKRPELDQGVPEIAKAVYDAAWKGAGNWPFNTAYAGSFRGMRAYVTRLSDVSELEDWVARGIPIGLSVCYNRLRGKAGGPNGHLVVCTGFTKDGDPIINDPGTSRNVRKTFPRQDLIHAWACSRNAVYLIYPQNSEIPKDRFGHWDSWSARRRIELE